MYKEGDLVTWVDPSTVESHDALFLKRFLIDQYGHGPFKIIRIATDQMVDDIPRYYLDLKEDGQVLVGHKWLKLDTMYLFLSKKT